MVCASFKGLDQPAHMYSLIRAFASCLKTIYRLAFEVSILKGGRTGSSEPIRAKMPQCPCADPEGG